MLDDLYGLLEPAESAALAAHVAACPACTIEWAKATGEQTRLAKASKDSFPKVTFTKPAEASTVVRETQRTVRSVAVNWVVAASVILVACGALVPALWTMGTYVTARGKLSTSRADLDRATNDVKTIRADFETVTEKAQANVAAAKAKYDDLVRTWISAEHAAGRPFAVTVRGPAAAIPGAPNDYAIAAVDGSDRPVAASITATVRGSSGQVYFNSTFSTADGRGANLKVPASVWKGVPTGETLSLSIKATQPGTGQTSELSEPLALLTASYATVLSTDAPIYRPGDQIAFRSLTLDRTTFAPPERHLALAFCLLDSRGQIVTVGPEKRELMLRGSTRLEQVDGALYRPVIGPDGKPVLGVGCGELRIPTNLPAGAYSLAVYELPIGASKPTSDAKPLATRPVTIRQFESHRFAKSLTFDKASYAPGETVTVTLTVSEQGRPVSNRQLMVAATADGQPILDVAESKLTDGTATIRFTLPKGCREASVSVAILDGVHETIVRPVPVAGGQVKLDIFPEGGDLVAGVPNRIYVRARGPNDRPFDFDGAIHDGDTVVATIRSHANPDRPGANRGIGIASFTPRTNAAYTLKVTLPAPQTVALPAVKADGVALAIPAGVFRHDEPISCRIASPVGRRVTIGAYARGTPIAHKTIDLAAGEPATVGLVPDLHSPGGVVRVTVFDEPDMTQPGRKDLKPVAERLIYRAPSRRLDLGIAVKSNDATVGDDDARAAFRPNEPLRVRVDARSESGQPVPAILFATVAAETLYSAADDLTDRSLPTHFLLNGEVERPEALERADFLLSADPAAAIALDGLLGTQGWRRFAEQNPAQFRRTAPPAEADRLLVAVGSRTPVSREYGPAVERVIREFQPKYDAAYEAWSAAERAADEVRRGSPPAQAFAAASNAADRAVRQWNTDVGELKAVLEHDDSRLLTDVVLYLLVGLVAVLVGVRVTVARSWPERRTLTVGVFVMIGLLAVPFVATRFVVLRARDLQPIDSGSVAAAMPPRADRTDVLEVNTTTVESLVGPVIRLLPSATAIDEANGRPIVLARDGLDLGNRTGGDHVPTRDEHDARLAKRRAILESVESPSLVATAEAGVPSVVREYSTINFSRFGDSFTEVLYWHPAIVVPGEGVSPWLPFTVNDAAMSYRVTVAGHAPGGRLGQATTRIRTAKALEAGAKLPREIGTNDRIDLVATARVSGDREAIRPRLYVRATNLAVETTNEVERELLPVDSETGVGRRVVSLVPQYSGPASVSVSTADSESTRGDLVSRPVTVVPAGEIVEGAINGVLANGRVSFDVAIPGDIRPRSIQVKLLADPLAEFEASLAAIAKSPAACFEQSASNLYPQLLMLPWLEAAKARTVRDSLPGQFRKLLAYECESAPNVRAGFDWFGGRNPPHEALTAYGLQLFADLGREGAIDADLLRRTRQFLLATRDGQGGFRQAARATDRIGRAPKKIADAYIAYALKESDPSIDLSYEIDVATAAAFADDDPYRLALTALVNPVRGEMLRRLAAKQSPDGGVQGATTSITASGGPDLLTETTALAVLAWQRGDGFDANVQRGLRYLLSRRQPGGGFGGTQATVLALKAIRNIPRDAWTPTPFDTWQASVNGAFARPRTLSLSRVIEIPVVANDVTIGIESTVSHELPVSIVWTGIREPRDRPHPKLGFSVRLRESDVAAGATVPMFVTVANREPAACGMIVARIGLPAGLTIPADGKQITNALHGSGRTDSRPVRWELVGRELRLYYLAFQPDTSSTTIIDLIAEYPGRYEGAPSRAQRSYDASVEAVLSPLKVTIRP
jgi:hypothetical protein